MTRPIQTLALLILLSMLTAAGAAAQIILIPRASTWNFEDSGVDLGTSWRPLSYSDAGWASGPAPLGYGESFIVTPTDFGPNPNAKYPTTYFRHEFTFTDTFPDVTFLEIEANFDDGFVAYLNGTEVLRRSLPGGVINYTTLAGLHEGGFYEANDITAFKSALLTGQNVLAVEVHQASATSSDLVADFALNYS
ncbi:MAG: hypothetical protein HKN20_09190, partial [Gemmatimonadetes bacterium]|nr:hypothetical protein [Gemmatimonadota bacterium]